MEINNGTTNALIMGVANGSGAYSSDASTNDAIIRNNGAKLILQSGQSASAICITTTNNVGIGTASPSHKLDVTGNVNAMTSTGGTINSLSNLGMWSSNTANWTSNNLGAFSNNNLVLSQNLNIGGNLDIGVGYSTFRKGQSGATGTFTHIPFTDGVNRSDSSGGHKHIGACGYWYDKSSV